jgi:hypothetical protein
MKLIDPHHHAGGGTARHHRLRRRSHDRPRLGRRDQEVLRSQLDKFEAATGHKVTIVSMPESTTDQFGQYKLWLSAQSSDIDVYRLDVIWAPQLAEHFIDLTEPTMDILDQFIPSTLEGQTVDGKLVALPMFIGAPALYYRQDLLEKYGEEVPATWEELTATAQKILDGERAEGNSDMQGFVFQGAAYEGLTCNAMEWVASYGGGNFVEPDGSIAINNPKAAEALTLAASWIGTIAPEGVLNYKEEDARGVFQSGNASSCATGTTPMRSSGRRQPGQGHGRRVAAALGRRGPALGRDAGRLGARRVEILREPGSGDRACEVPHQLREPEGTRDRHLAPADPDRRLQRPGSRRRSSPSSRCGNRCSTARWRAPRRPPSASTTRPRRCSGPLRMTRCRATARPRKTSPS